MSHFCTKLAYKVTFAFFFLLIWTSTVTFINNYSKKIQFKQEIEYSEYDCSTKNVPQVESCCSATYWDRILDSRFLTNTQLTQYFLWSNRSSCRLAHDFGGIMEKNPSGIAGQKTVCLDPQVAPKPNECLVYSFGIDNEWSFDEQMELYGCEVFSFDPSMGVENHNHSRSIHFYNWGLGNKDEYDNNLNWTIRSLSSIYKTLSIIHGNKVIDYLKIDIEYSEWLALPQIIESGILSNVRQLGMEIHLEHLMPMEKHREWSKILRSVEKKGMIRFDSKFNPWSFGSFIKDGKIIQMWGPLGYEIAWYNSQLLHP
jgi:hypothetical protein